MPLLAFVPTSALIGTSRARSAGVTVTDGGAASARFATDFGPAVHAPTASGATATVIAKSVSRRLTNIFRPPFRHPLAHIL
ncbi:hypothetical protein TPA0908_49550 [Micromonospora sp. AKA38]|nr:hypothetical protein TPA0908_49550 [Micromonospora sp. AKA38]